MATWVNPETGELVEGDCPFCTATREEAETQIRAMERERRSDRIARAKAEKAVEDAKVAKRDGAVWKHVLACWLKAFPDKRPTATGIKSVRATAVFARLESGASVVDVEDAIVGAWKLPFVVYGVRRETGGQGDRKDDLQDIMSLTSDANFDRLRDVGHALRNPDEPT